MQVILVFAALSKYVKEIVGPWSSVCCWSRTSASSGTLVRNSDAQASHRPSESDSGGDQPSGF